MDGARGGSLGGRDTRYAPTKSPTLAEQRTDQAAVAPRLQRGPTASGYSWIQTRGVVYVHPLVVYWLDTEIFLLVNGVTTLDTVWVLMDTGTIYLWIQPTPRVGYSTWILDTGPLWG